jgi:hypothetical protein
MLIASTIGATFLGIFIGNSINENQNSSSLSEIKLSKPESPLLLSVSQKTTYPPYNIEIDFNVVTNATGYNVYRSSITFPSTDPTSLASMLITSLPLQLSQVHFVDVIANLPDPPSCYYAITATNDAGESALSNSISIVIVAPARNDGIIGSTQQCRLDESATFQPYESLLNQFDPTPTIGELYLKGTSVSEYGTFPYSLRCYQLSTVHDTDLIAQLQLSSTNLLYCPNGTARIIFGSCYHESRSSNVLLNIKGSWYEIIATFIGTGLTWSAVFASIRQANL